MLTSKSNLKAKYFILIIFQLICLLDGFSQEIETKTTMYVSENNLNIVIEINNNDTNDIIIPGYEWFITGWVNCCSRLNITGQFKTMNSITYKNKNMDYYRFSGMIDGELNYDTEFIPYFINIKPNEKKVIKLLINRKDFPKEFFEQKEYLFEFELAYADIDLFTDFNRILDYKLRDYVIDKEEYVLNIKKYHKGSYYYTCDDFNSKKRFDKCVKKTFYLAFKKNIKIKGELKLND